MTDKTATQNLTRTQATDDPRKQALYLATLAGEIDQRMTTQYHHIGRSQVPPAALVRRLEPMAFSTLDASPNVLFDTVEFDTFGLVDLATQPHGIPLSIEGYWVVGGYAQVTGWPTGTGEFLLQLFNAQGSVNAAFHDGAAGFAAGAASVLSRATTPLTSIAALGIDFLGTLPGGAEGSTLNYAELWAYKVRDL